jgi:hypothetical protein
VTDVESILYSPLEDVSDALSDLRKAQFQNFQNVLIRFLSLFGEEPLFGFLQAVLPSVDFKTWWERAKSTGGSMVGSGTLDWPIARAERVAMQLALCNAIAKGEIQFLHFAHQYCYAGTNQLSAHVREFADVILEPMLRDIKRLTETRPLQPVLFEAMGRLPESGDDTLDTMLREACQKFRDPAPAARREAVERLWDAWERLKSLDHATNKRISVDVLLSTATDDAALRAVLEAEAKTLTSIGNDFHIRHFEANRSAISRIEHYEYLFHRLFALMYLLLFTRGRPNAA